MEIKNNIGIYIHWPYCNKICPYCDFVVKKNTNIDQDTWYKILTYDLVSKFNLYKDETKTLPVISSIYFGGGTPSLMPTKLFKDIIEFIFANYDIYDDCEITCETNIEDFNNFRSLKDNKVNRLSIGLQSTNYENLKFLGREHTYDQIHKSLHEAKKNFNNISADLIYSVNQNITPLTDDIALLTSYGINHISTYALTIEPKTIFHAMFKKGELIPLDDEKSTEQFYLIENLLLQNNYDHYEISNYAMNGYYSNHNLLYWNYKPFIGIGPGAASRIRINEKIYEILNNRSVKNYLSSSLGEPNVIWNKNELSKSEIFIEKLFMGLRLKNGIIVNKLLPYFPHENKNLFYDKINELKNDGFVIIQNGYLIIEKDKRHLTDQIAKQIMTIY